MADGPGGILHAVDGGKSKLPAVAGRPQVRPALAGDVEDLVHVRVELADKAAHGGAVGLYLLFRIGRYGGCGCGVVPGALAYGEGQTDRDVLKLETAMVSANALSTAQLETGIREIINNQNKNTAAILEGQKDLYIRDLERVATQQFITSQNEQTRNLITLATANQEAKSAAEACALNNRLTQIEDKMLKAPMPVPFVGLPTVGCANYGAFPGSCCPTTV